MPLEVKLYQMEPAPVFSGAPNSASLATIYMTHYERLMAVVAAARSGNSVLIKLALKHFDEWGCKDENESSWRNKVL